MTTTAEWFPNLRHEDKSSRRERHHWLPGSAPAASWCMCADPCVSVTMKISHSPARPVSADLVEVRSLRSQSSTDEAPHGLLLLGGTRQIVLQVVAEHSTMLEHAASAGATKLLKQFPPYHQKLQDTASMCQGLPEKASPCTSDRSEAALPRPFGLVAADLAPPIQAQNALTQ